MKQIVNEIVKLAKEDRKVLKALKRIAIDNQKYEMAANLRDIEVEAFPESKTTSPEYEEAKIFKTFLNVADIGVRGYETAYVILQCAKTFLEKGGESAIDDVTGIQAKAKTIFG